MLLLPPHVIAAQRKELQQRILRCTTVDDPRCQYFTTRLKLRSEDAWMVRAHDTVDADLPLRPGYYHVLILNQDAPMTVIPVTNNGKYVEPGDWIFEQLNRMDLREGRVRRRLAEQEQEAEEAEKKRVRTMNEDRRAKLGEIVKSATRAQVSMDRTIPWTQNSQGRRER